MEHHYYFLHTVQNQIIQLLSYRDNRLSVRAVETIKCTLNVHGNNSRYTSIHISISNLYVYTRMYIVNLDSTLELPLFISSRVEHLTFHVSYCYINHKLLGK